MPRTMGGDRVHELGLSCWAVSPRPGCPELHVMVSTGLTGPTRSILQTVGVGGTLVGHGLQEHAAARAKFCWSALPECS